MEDDEVQMDHDAELEAFLPGGFGRQERIFDPEAQIESARRVPAKVPTVKQEERDSDADTDDDDSDEDDDEDEFPTSHDLLIKTHEKAVTSATLDTSGARLVTGSADCTLKLHDFSAMTPTTIRAFKSVDPSATKTSANVETHPVHQVTFNPHSPQTMLVITALPQIKLFDRDGEQVAATPKGDMYLRDMHNTKGHVSEVTCGAWHPSDQFTFVTAGTDSTLRIWNSDNLSKQREVIVHKSRAVGSAGRSRMTAVAWGSQAQGGQNMLVTAAYDGALVLYAGNQPFSRPSGLVADAHTPETWTSSLDVSPDGRTVVSRGGDDLLKLWDLRSFKKPISTVSHPSTSSTYPTSSARFSPSGGNILVGSPTGDLHILNSATLRPEHVTPVTPGSALIAATWHPRLNQIVTSSANAETHVLFAPRTAHAGALTVLRKPPKAKHFDDSSASLAPSALEPAEQPARRPAPRTGLTQTGRSRDPRRPHVPEATPFAGSNPSEQYVRDTYGLSRMREEDPREALLKFKDKKGIYTKIWERNQPNAVFADAEDDEEEEPDAKRPKR